MYEPTFRPIINVVRVTPDASCVEVVLDHDGRVASGFGDVTGVDMLTAAALGTCEAVDRLVPDGFAVTLQWVRLLEVPDVPLGQSSVVTSAVGVQRADGADLLVGSALVHHDPVVAAVRATLDGMTRRLALALFTAGLH